MRAKVEAGSVGEQPASNKAKGDGLLQPEIFFHPFFIVLSAV
jgi:hypothetical protein